MPYYILSNGELYHHGVKGMRWGRRRYQNEDGTLTEAGKKHYAKASTSDVARRSLRGYAGPSVYVGRPEKRIAQYKKELDILDKGGHLSIGITKKRQAAYDARDRAALNKRIAKAEFEVDERAKEIAMKKLAKAEKRKYKAYAAQHESEILAGKSTVRNMWEDVIKPKVLRN